MVHETVSTKLGLTNFASFMYIEGHSKVTSNGAKEPSPLFVEPVTSSLFLYLCCRLGIGSDLVAAGALLVSYYAGRYAHIQ
jgi:hypothetical protein